MDKEYVPGTTTLKLTAGSFLVLGLLAIIASGAVGFIIIAAGVLIFLLQWAVYAARYQKFTLTDTSLIIKGISGKIQDEIQYKDIHKVFFRAGTIQNQLILTMDADVEEISLWMNTGFSVHLNMTPIDNSGELFTLLKQRVDAISE